MAQPAANRFVLGTDVKAYCASIDHLLLLDRLAEIIGDKRVLDLLGQYLRRITGSRSRDNGRGRKASGHIPNSHTDIGRPKTGTTAAGQNAAIPDLGRYRSANVLVKHHAEDTPSEANVRTNALCATITGDWEKPSGEFRLKDGEILWVRTGSDLNPVRGRTDPARFVGREPLSSLGASSTWPCYFW